MNKYLTALIAVSLAVFASNSFAADTVEDAARSNVQKQQQCKCPPPKDGAAGQNGEMTKGEPPKGQPPKGQPPKGQPPKGQPPKGQPPKGQPPKGQPPKGQPPKGQPPKGQPPKDSDECIC